MSTLRFTVPGEPRGWARARTSGARFFTDNKTRSEKQAVASWAIEAGARIINGPVLLVIRAYVGIPRSASKKRQAAMLEGREIPCKKPDFDNIQKLIGDALTGVVWSDDVQVSDAIFSKRWSDRPRLEIEISPVTGINQQSDGNQRTKAA